MDPITTTALLYFGLKLIAKNPTGNLMPSTNPHAQIIKFFGGRPLSSAGYPNTVEGFQKYLNDCGVNKAILSAVEMTTPNHKDVAAKHGYSVFLPPQAAWPKGVALALAHNYLRVEAGSPVRMRNWWRPKAYDMEVGGSGEGDHPDADAVDLDFTPNLKTGESALQVRNRVAARVEQWYRDHGVAWRMSKGIYPGSPSIHLGFLSRKGHREWNTAG